MGKNKKLERQSKKRLIARIIRLENALKKIANQVVSICLSEEL